MVKETSMSKAAMLAAIRAALSDVPTDETPDDVPVARDYLRRDALTAKQRLKLFEERIQDYKVEVVRVKEKEIARQVAQSCAVRGAWRLAVPPDLPPAWRADGLTFLEDDALSYADLDASDGVLTGCALAVAQTGTIVLDGGATQGRRALTLLPDYHLCVVFDHQLVGVLPEAFKALKPSVTAGRPLTFISGPSATSDIELNRVEGVHGPRTLIVVLAG